MRTLSLLLLSLLISACSTYAPRTPAKTNTHQPCSESVCGKTGIVWQETLRKRSMTSQLLNSERLAVTMDTTTTRAIVNAVYREVIATTDYISDNEAYARFDIYPTPTQLKAAMQNGRYRGDCTTFSHLFYYKLIEHGIHPDRILRVRMDLQRRPGQVMNHLAVLVDNTWLLDSAEPGKRVVLFEKSVGIPKMWLSENASGWYNGAQGQAPLVDTRFRGFSLALQ